MTVQEFIKSLGNEIEDAEEETFLLYATDKPSRGLGMLDATAQTLELTVAGHDLTIHQSPGLLRSNRTTGTTGAVVWDVTPVFAEWIASPSNLLFEHDILSSTATILELGSGIAGVVGLVLAPLVYRFVFTDQNYVLKTLRQNIEENTKSHLSQSKLPVRGRRPKSGKSGPQTARAAGNIEIMELDWQESALQQLPALLHNDQQTDTGEEPMSGVDVILAVDCVFNENLVEPLVQTCQAVCSFRSSHIGHWPTVCIFAQQLRQPDVFELWLTLMMRYFRVWRMPNDKVSKGLADRSGFVIHVAVLKRLPVF